VALLENGTHVLWAAHMANYATDELTLAEKVVPALQKACFAWRIGFSPAISSGKKQIRRERICCGELDRTRDWTWTGAYQTVLTLAAFTPLLPIAGINAKGLWSA